MGDKTEVWQGTLALMVLKTLDTMGPLHGYGIARRIEQTSGDLLAVNYGTLYPALLKLEQEGSIASEWGTSENNRKAKYYRLTRAGRRELALPITVYARPSSSRFPPCSTKFGRLITIRGRTRFRACRRMAGKNGRFFRSNLYAGAVEASRVAIYFIAHSSVAVRESPPAG
jgi:PadR family transcriptional regulator PadR